MALYNSRGTISAMSEVQTGTGRSGNTWQRMTLTLDIPGYQGAITKQVFQVFGDNVNDVEFFEVGDKVEVSWSMYAREWKGKWYNNVDLVKIKPQDESSQEKPAPSPAQDAPQPEQMSIEESVDPENDLPF